MAGRAHPSVGGAGNEQAAYEDDALFNDDSFLDAVAKVEAEHLGRLSSVLSNNESKVGKDDAEKSFDRNVSWKRNNQWEGQNDVYAASRQGHGEDDSRKKMRVENNEMGAPRQDQNATPREPEGEYMAALRGSNSASRLSSGAGRGTYAGSQGTSSKAAPVSFGEGIQKSGTCYKCGVEGHWARDCPGGALKSGPSTGVGGHMQGRPSEPERLCPCGGGPCAVLTANTEKNPGRSFFRCPLLKEEGQCTFFEWCDASEQSMTSDASPFQPLNPHLQLPCRCGAGPCAVLTAKTDQNMGRQFFKCPLPQGCSFFQWCDEVRNDNGRQNPASSSRVDYQSSGVGSPAPASGNCFKCGQNGHWSRECPLGQQQQGGGLGGQSSYSNGRGPSDGRGGENCYKCGGQGHWSSSCPNNALQGNNFSGSGGAAAGGTCFKCGQPGHWANRCTNS